MTRARPISSSSGIASTAGRPSKKCSGASTCVPVCVPITSFELLSAVPVGDPVDRRDLEFGGFPGIGGEAGRKQHAHVDEARRARHRPGILSEATSPFDSHVLRAYDPWVEESLMALRVPGRVFGRMLAAAIFVCIGALPSVGATSSGSQGPETRCRRASPGDGPAAGDPEPGAGRRRGDERSAGPLGLSRSSFKTIS